MKVAIPHLRGALHYCAPLPIQGGTVWGAPSFRGLCLQHVSRAPCAPKKKAKVHASAWRVQANRKLGAIIPHRFSLDARNLERRAECVTQTANLSSQYESPEYVETQTLKQKIFFFYSCGFRPEVRQLFEADRGPKSKVSYMHSAILLHFIFCMC